MNNSIFNNLWIWTRFILWLSSFTPSEKVALFAALLVLFGVIGEEVVELKFLDATERARLKRNIKRWSISLLLLGLSGDVVGINMGQAEMSALTIEAGNAAQSARTAREESDSAKKSASDSMALARGARQEADSFEKDIVSAKKQAADAESHLAGALQRAAAAQLALDRLRAPRTLTLAQRERIASKLKLLPKMQYDLALTNLPEAAEFSLMVEKTLGMAGWTEIDWNGGDIVSRRSSGPTTGFVTATGVVIQMHKEQVPTFWPEAVALAEALNAEGIEAKAEPGVGPPNTNSNAIHILIGEKPK
jgi:hypothetical protein